MTGDVGGFRVSGHVTRSVFRAKNAHEAARDDAAVGKVDNKVAARARGWVGGRPRVFSLDTSGKVSIAQSLYDDQRNTIAEICKTLNISRATLYRYIRIRKNA